MKVWILHKTGEDFETLRLLAEFEKINIPATVVNPTKFDIVVHTTHKTRIHYDGQLTQRPDILISRTGSGTDYFAAAVIREIEKLGAIVINNSNAIELVKDKLATHQRLATFFIPTPKTMLLHFPVKTQVIKDEIGFPCVVKVITGSYGKGVHLCHNRKQFESTMELIDNLGSKRTMIVQEYISATVGADLRVLVIGGKVIGAMKRTAPKGDFRANITNGGTGEPFPLTDEVEHIARETAKAMGLDIAGVDLLFDVGSFKVCECNSAPGFEGFEKFVGVDVAKEIVNYVRLKLLLANKA
jgi:RimK family alpha-L-glutamate ligase